MDGALLPAGDRAKVLDVLPSIVHDSTVVFIDDTHRDANRELAEAIGGTLTTFSDEGGKAFGVVEAG